MGGSKLYKQFLFILGLAILFIPIRQQLSEKVKERPLKGDFYSARQPQLGSGNWFSGKLQDSLQEYLNENFGFRATLVRLDHEIAYRLFKKISSPGVIVGQDHVLYGLEYIDSYYGRNYAGDSLNN